MHWPTTVARHGAPPPASRHTTISRHASTKQVYIIKTRKNDTYYYHEFDYYVHNALTATMRSQAMMPATAYGPSPAVPMQ